MAVRLNSSTLPRVRPSHPLAQGLLFYAPITANGAVDRVSGVAGVPSTAGGFGRAMPGYVGSAWENDGSDAGYIRFPVLPSILALASSGLWDCSATILFHRDTIAAYHFPFSIYHSSGADSMSFRMAVTSTLADFRIRQSNNTKNARSGTGLANADETAIVTARRIAEDGDFYKNGVFHTLHTGRFITAASQFSTDCWIDIAKAADGGTAYAWDGLIGLVAIHARSISPGEIAQFHADPFDLITMPRIVLANTVSGGSPVSVTPTPVSAVMASTGTAVKGSIAIAPTADSSIAATAGPTVIAGSIAVTPASVATIAATTSDGAIKGSYSLTPTQSAAVASVASPGVLLGSIVVTPTACSAVMSMTGSYTTGIGTVEPTPIAAVAATVNPTVIKGSITESPTADSTVTATAGPTVVLGSVAVSPSSVQTVMATTGTVAAGDIFVTPTAGYIVTTSTGTAIMGAYAPTLDPSGAVTATVSPTVIKGSLSTTPTADSAIMAAIVGDVLLSGAVRPDAIGAIMATAIGAVVGSGPIEITLSHESAVALTLSDAAVTVCTVESVNV